MPKKICNECLLEKELNDFSPHKGCEMGVQPKCKTCRKNIRAIWRTSNRHIECQNSKRYRESHREQIKIRRRKYENHRQVNDTKYVLKKILRSRLYMSLEGEMKHSTTLELLGCSLEEFKMYLESKFKNGMTWQNRGVKGWHIDHIIPCSAFDLSDPKQQKKCFHYSNLQPLWWHENLAKGNKLLPINV